MSRPHCCFLTMDDMAHYVNDDDLAIAPLNDLGWDVSTISWRDPRANWDDFDIAVIRSTWDYQKRPQEFLEVLARIDASSARLENSIDIVKWNLDKRYLRDVEERGSPIVPTIWDATYDQRSFYRWIADLGTDELIIKPTISATAQHTYRLQEFDDELTTVFAERSFMVQPFLQSVVDEGEYSLFYFNGEYSHTILKTPKPADFRVQEEHGGIINGVEPTDELLAAGQTALDLIGSAPLYARIDLIRGANGTLLVMELELIEPALYLRMDAGSPARFAAAIDRRMRGSI